MNYTEAMICYHIVLKTAAFIIFFWGMLAASYGQLNEQTLRMGISQNLKKKFPQYNGVVWSHDVAARIFEQAGFVVKPMEYPARRTGIELLNGRTDCVVTGFQYFVGKTKKQVLMARFPTAVLSFYIYYKNTPQWQPTWPPDEVFKNKLGKSQSGAGVFSREYGMQVAQAASVDSIVKMVNLQRIDYWLDYYSLHQQVSFGLLKNNGQGFTYKHLLNSEVLMYFKNDARGAKLKKIYDQGFLDMLMRGEFVSVFSEKVAPVDKQAVLATLALIRERNPGLVIPKQNGIDNLMM